MYRLFALSLFLNVTMTFAQLSEAEVLALREHHALELSDTIHGVLNQEEINEFGGLDYFDFDAEYQIKGTFTKDKGKVFKMATSTERLPKYRRYGYVTFTHDGVECKLELYQSMSLKRNKEYRDYLFLPFRDKTSRNETYGGGRFMDLKIPNGQEIIVDFNTAYNPYCAYSYRYSCPIPPEANTLSVAIRAGEKTPHGH